jgi:hypothetical protein
MPRFQIGDRVKLTDAVAKTFGHTTSGKHLMTKALWHKRRGTVVAYAITMDDVSVKWDDRVTPDHWPAKALELIPSN